MKKITNIKKLIHIEKITNFPIFFLFLVKTKTMAFSDDSYSSTSVSDTPVKQTYQVQTSAPIKTLLVSETPTAPSTSTPKIESTIDAFVYSTPPTTGGVKPLPSDDAPTGGVKPLPSDDTTSTTGGIKPIQNVDDIKLEPTRSDDANTDGSAKEKTRQTPKLTKNLKPFLIGGAVILGIVIISKILKSNE